MSTYLSATINPSDRPFIPSWFVSLFNLRKFHQTCFLYLAKFMCIGESCFSLFFAHLQLLRLAKSIYTNMKQNFVGILKK